MRPPPSRTRAGRSPTGTGPGRGRALRRTGTTRPRPRDRRPPQAGRRVCTSSLTGSGTIAWFPLRGCTRMQSGRTDQAKKFTKAAGSAPEREGSTWQFSTGFPTWAGLRPWPDPGRILGGSCHALARGITCRRARRVAEHPLRYHMVSCRGLPPAPTWIQASHFCNGPRLPCAQCAEHEALETAHTSQRIMEIYLQGLQRCMAQFWPQRLSCFYWVSV